MRIVAIEPTLNVGCTQCSAQSVQALVSDGQLMEVIETQCAVHAALLEEAV